MTAKVWENPDVFSIQVELPQNPLRTLNVYVIMTPEQNLLIDTGFNRSECRTALWEGIRELGLDLNKTSVFLTHFHSDHIGLVWDFVERDCPVYMGRIDYRWLDKAKSGGTMSAMEELFRREGFPSEELALQKEGNQGRKYGVKQIFPAQLVDDGSVISLGGLEVRCIHTPGHTPGHMVLYLPREELLFAGDHILFDITPNISVWNGVPHSLEDYMESLKKIDALPVRAAFPAHRHGEGDVHQRISALLAHHEERLEEVRRAVEQNPGASAFQIAGMITWSVRGLGWERFPPHQKWFAMGEALAHLRYLCDHGQVFQAGHDGIFTYHGQKPPA